MHLARHSITSTTPVNVIDVRFDADCDIFAAATPSGFGVYKTWPLRLVRKRDLTGTVSKILPLHKTNIIFLVGGGRNPRYPPNKVIFWDESIGKEVVELEFREQVRGLACRRGTLAVALKRRIVVFDVSNDRKVARTGEWETCENERGLLALATVPDATLLIAPGRQVGHVQLIHLTPCPPPPLPSPPPDTPPISHPTAHRPTRNPVSIIVAHTTSLTTLALPASGRLISTTSSRGTLIRVWNATTGKLLKELRRGSDSAVIYGVAFRGDETELCVWSDKGTVHVFKISDKEGGASNRQSTFSPLSGYLHRYFSSQWSYAQYRLPSSSTHISLHSATTNNSRPLAPEDEKCTVGWIEVPVVVTPPSEAPTAAQSSKASGSKTTAPKPAPQQLRQTQTDYQLVALTFSGCWYRLSVPSSLSSTNTTGAGAGSSSSRRFSSSSSYTATEKGKGKSKRKDESYAGDMDDERPERECSLIEFKRFGRWDGWG
ncbi:hypothetical protein FRB96_007588 [Tulasnella sp. 330]|nr:hypothetical protein FRB96_007588 [Tulasnella sp. 330]KAG8889151.1 hypothetical protein FRB98_005626 [Tulasnella sp. 332]